MPAPYLFWRRLCFVSVTAYTVKYRVQYADLMPTSQIVSVQKWLNKNHLVTWASHYNRSSILTHKVHFPLERKDNGNQKGISTQSSRGRPAVIIWGCRRGESRRKKKREIVKFYSGNVRAAVSGFILKYWLKRSFAYLQVEKREKSTVRNEMEQNALC